MVVEANNTIELSSLDGSNGFVINGIDAYDNSGVFVNNAGDINGDGIEDLIIGASGADSNGNLYGGESYVIFGNSNGFDSTLELSDLDGSNGFVINGMDAFDYSGVAVSNAGDINGDGIEDLIIGAFGAYPNGNPLAGESYVVFGNSDGFDSTLELSDLDGSNGFVINGIDTGDVSGASVSNAGDINGDNIDDVIIGALGATVNGNVSAGESYVVFGNSNGFDSTLELSDLDGSNGFVINGIDTGDISGVSVSNAEDVNGDNIDDVIIGAFGASPNGNLLAGESYVVFGNSSGFDSSLDLSDLDGSNGFVINGIDTGDVSGNSVSNAGDVNGDGTNDLIIGAFGANAGLGESYIVFGDSNGFDSTLELSDLDGSNGFVINGIDTGDNSGYSVSGAGDINGDGIGDVIIGANTADPNGNVSAGESYVVFGNSDGFDSTLELSDLDGSNGFVINGIDAGDLLGNSVSGAGDVNGDGIDDLIIGATYATPNGNLLAGESYVIFGNANPSLDLNGTSAGINFTANFDENPISIVDSTNLSLTDANTETITGGTVTISNLLDGEDEFLTATTTGNISASYDPDTGILTLSGEDTVANYQDVFQSIQYGNNSDSPTTDLRFIEFLVDDGESHSNVSDLAFSTVSFGDSPINLDIDGNGEADALTDGILLLRFLFGFTGDSLINGAVAPDATLTSSFEIESVFSTIPDTAFDVDGNGEADALTDGILVLRFLFGFTGDSLINDAVAPDATLTTSDAISAFIESSLLPVV